MSKQIDYSKYQKRMEIEGAIDVLDSYIDTFKESWNLPRACETLLAYYGEKYKKKSYKKPVEFEMKMSINEAVEIIDVFINFVIDNPDSYKSIGIKVTNEMLDALLTIMYSYHSEKFIRKSIESNNVYTLDDIHQVIDQVNNINAGPLQHEEFYEGMEYFKNNVIDILETLLKKKEK